MASLKKDSTGHKVPDVIFKIRQDFQWVTKTSDDFFKGKKVILFGLPGAFTPTCSTIHLPTYNDFYEAFKEHGIDEIICVSVNDSFVLNEWKKAERADHITMLPDGNGEFTEKLGLLVNKKDQNLGKRSWRYSMLVEDGIIKKMFVEPEGEEDPYGESSAEKMLEYLDPHAHIPDSVTIFTKGGCKYCARVKELLNKYQLKYEELVLNKDFTIKTVKAISGGTKLPQVFINGERVGGAQDLEEYLYRRKNLTRNLEGSIEMM